MIRRARPGARRLALLAVVVGTAAGIALGVVGCIQGVDDADEYGRVPLPGEGALDLPADDVALYYESHVDLGENDSLDVPDGLRVVAQRENTKVRSKKVLQNQISTDNRALREFGKLEIPRAGRYRVTVRSRQGGSYSPAVTFGKGQLGNLGESAARTLIPMGAGLGAALLCLLLGRIGYEPLSPQELAASLPSSPSASPWAAAGAPAPGRASGVPASWANPSPPGAPPASPPVAPPAAPPGSDPVEAQLRELERQHAAGQLQDDEYHRRRQQVIDAAFGRPGS